MVNQYVVDRECTFKGITYKVIEVLDNNLLLVVNKADIDNNEFPLKTFVIPDNQ